MRIGNSIGIPWASHGARGLPPIYIPPSPSLVLRGDTGVTGALGGNVTAIADQSGNGVTLAPNGSSGNRPTRDSTGKWLVFPDTNAQRIDNTSAPFFSGTGMLGNAQPSSGIAVVWFNDITDGGADYLFQCGTSANNVAFVRQSGNLTFTATGSSSTATVSTSLAGLASQWLVVWYTYTGTRGDLGINSTTSLANNVNMSRNTTTGAGTASCVGANVASGGAMKGRIAYLAASTVAWSPAQLAAAYTAASAYRARL